MEKVQRRLPGVEYLLWVVHKVDNQKLHKSQKLNSTRALQGAPQSITHLLLILWLYSCPQHVPNLFCSPWALNLLPALLTLAQWLRMTSSWPLHSPSGCTSLAWLPLFFHVAGPPSCRALASNEYGCPFIRVFTPSPPTSPKASSLCQ